MHSSTWKSFERRVAKLFGTVRIQVDGRGDRPDFESSTIVAEVKLWSSQPRQVVNALEQAERNCTPDKLPLAVIGHKHHRWQDALVVMRLGDFIEWYDPGAEVVSNGE